MCAATLAAGTLAAQSPAAARTVWDGVYTEAQVERIGGLYRDQCASCHGTQMRGAPGSPALAGAEFLVWWEGRTAADLLDVTRRTMPPGGAGRLTSQQYADLLAAMFQASGFPPGSRELTADRQTLENLRIVRRKPE